jgi:hypothetical protein
MKIRGFNFKYCVEYDYDSYRNCENYGCNEEGICRCSTIENAHIVSVDVTNMVMSIKDEYFDNTKASKRNSKINSVLGNITDDIDFYTIDRILRINGVWEPSNWDVQVCSGYYGQEIDDVILEDSVASKIEKQLEEAFDITDLTKRIEYLLILEYGYILPELKDCRYEVDTILRDKVIFGSEGQYRKVATEKLSHYSDKNYHSYRGIVIPKGDQYRLIDGYHRCFASEDTRIDVLKVISK